MTDILDDEELSPPGKPDFRRVGRWNSPQVVMPNGKRSTYGRFSNAGKLLDDESNLTDWKLCTTVWGASFRPELMAQASTLHIKADRNELRDIAEECLASGKGKERAVKGTAIHSMFDHLDLDDGWEPAPQWQDLCNSYITARDLWGLIPEDIEVNCVSHEFRLAGRMDRRYRTSKGLVAPDGTIIPIGSRVVGDTKTGAVLEYAAGSYVTQMAGYALADRYDVTTDETIPFEPPTNRDWGLVIHADSAGTNVEIYWVDLNAGMEGLKLSQLIKGWRQRADLLTLGTDPVMPTGGMVKPTITHQPDPMEVVINVKPGTAPVDWEAAFRAYGTSGPPQAPVVAQEAPEAPVAPVVALAATLDPGARRESLYIHTRDRVKAILEFSDVAAKELARNWPAGIPGLKVDQHTMEQLQAIIDVVEDVEKNHSVPFFPLWDDPEVETSKERHPSFSDRWAKPSQAEPVTKHVAQTTADAINAHPRKELLREWVGKAVEGGIDSSINTVALSHALLEFASIDTSKWNVDPYSHDEQLSLFLEGTLRTLGYERGLLDLGNIKPDDAPNIMSAAFAIAAETGVLVYGDDGHPRFRANVKRT